MYDFLDDKLDHLLSSTSSVGRRDFIAEQPGREAGKKKSDKKSIRFSLVNTFQPALLRLRVIH